MRIDTCFSAKRPHKITGEKESFILHRLIDANGKAYIARAFPGGRVEFSNAADKPLNPRRDSALIERIQAVLDARWRRP